MVGSAAGDPPARSSSAIGLLRTRRAERHLFSQPRRQPSCWVRLVARLVARSGGQRWAWCDTRPLSKTKKLKPSPQNTYSFRWMLFKIFILTPGRHTRRITHTQARSKHTHLLFTHALGPAEVLDASGVSCVRDFTSRTPDASRRRLTQSGAIIDSRAIGVRTWPRSYRLPCLPRSFFSVQQYCMVRRRFRRLQLVRMC